MFKFELVLDLKKLINKIIINEKRNKKKHRTGAITCHRSAVMSHVLWPTTNITDLGILTGPIPIS